MNDLNRLISLCKASISIDINDHTTGYQSVDEYMNDMEMCNDGTISDINPDVFAEMIKRNTVVRVCFYPDTPVGNYTIYHYDVDEALKIALSVFN